MIPSNITKEHVLCALKDIDTGKVSIPLNRTSRDYNLLYNNQRYPPKFIISLANKYANGTLLSASSFTGGIETNAFLSERGFTVEFKSPQYNHSWCVLSPSVFLKEIDNSIFKYNESAIPKSIYTYFCSSFESNTSIILAYKNIIFDAHIILSGSEEPRAKLYWRENFTQFIKDKIPNWSKLLASYCYLPLIRFQKDEDTQYNYFIDIINPERINEYSINEANYELNYQLNREGRAKQYYIKKYERDPYNRRKAIEIHGAKCSVCDFDFSSHYGMFGEGYIEIHHKVPLSTLDEEVFVNPSTDLVPVCSNCHRMLHHNKNHVLTIEELKAIVRAARLASK